MPNNDNSGLQGSVEQVLEFWDHHECAGHGALQHWPRDFDVRAAHSEQQELLDRAERCHE